MGVPKIPAKLALLVLGEETEHVGKQVIGAAITVHRALGPGFPESVYEESLVIELTAKGIPFVRQKPITVHYRGHAVGEGRIDLLVADRVVVELKSVEDLLPVHTSQVVSYLRATKLRLGLLMNFNVCVLKHGLRRIVV